MKENLVKEKVKCYHCGDHCKEEHIVFDEKDFCCNGCKTVYEILSENDLCTYYELDENAGISLKSKDYKDKFAYLENEEISKMLVNFSEGEKSRIVLFIPSIHCSSCIWLLENLYKLRQGIETSRVNFVKKEITLEYNHNEISLRQLVELLASIGYEPYISLENENRRKQKSHNRSLYIKIGVAGFAFGNIMLLSFPEYFGFAGLDDIMVQKFIIGLNLLLSFPVIFYCASDYFKSAYLGLKQKYVSIDVPIAIGIIALFARSLYEIFSASGPGYLDSLAGLIFFLLIGRWFQNHTYEGLSFERDYRSYFPLAVLKKVAGKWDSAPVTSLEKGDIISIRNQEVIPADGILLSNSAAIDYSFVTGESDPVTKKSGDYIYAGGRQAGSIVELEVSRPVSQSYLTQLWNNEVFGKEDDSHLQGLVNKISKYFTIVILVIATAAFGYWAVFDIGKALYVFTAVLIVACPCALALSTPFTLGNVMRVFGKIGFYLKNSSVIERITEINHIVFDKTGTITLNSVDQLKFEGKKLSDSEVLKVVSVVKNSTHPLSRKIYHYLNRSNEEKRISLFEEIAGKGIQAKVDGEYVRLGSADFVLNGEAKCLNLDDHKLTSVYLKIDNEYKGRFVISNHYRKGLKKVLHSFNKLVRISMITGDNALEKKSLEETFPKGTTFLFQQEPGQKLEYIKASQANGEKLMMVGDGLNDAGALKQSNIGISVSENAANFTPASDAILDSRKFDQFHKLFRFCFTARRIIIMSFIISFLYNIVGLSFAVAGLLSPLFAAVLMPLSSITVVVFATVAVNLMAKIKKIL